MVKQNERTLVNFGRPVPKFLVLTAGTIAMICLVIGLVSTLGSNSFGLAGLFLFSIFGLAFFLWTNLTQWKRIAVGESNRNLSWEIDLPESQRRKLSGEVGNLARILEIPAEQISDLLSAYIVAEDLALRQIQQEARMPVMRHIQIGGVPFDGVLVKQDIITCVEVTFLVTPNVSQEKINVILNKMTATKKNFDQLKLGARTRLLLVLVTQLDPTAEAQLRASLVKKFGQTQVDVDIRLLDFESLQKIYALD
ncbi:MAG: hypothetical protein JSS81_17445 [Acidobacteria bacterium]|nr:hypothetical protein [Acidobacteriota bacterium]